MEKYRVLGKYHTGNVGDVIELREAEGDGAVKAGKLEKVSTAKPKHKPRRKAKS